MNKIAIVTSHPIQYNAPWFQLLSKQDNVDLLVFYTWSQAEQEVKDHVFGTSIKWDIPLLDGYNYTFVENVSISPGTHHWRGIICPSLISRIEEFNPDIVLVFGWYLKSHFQVINFFKKKRKVWFRGDSTLLSNTSPLKSFIRNLWLRYIYHGLDKALYVGTENKKYFKWCGLRNDKLFFVPHAIDIARFTDAQGRDYESRAQKWRRDLGIEPEDFVILYAGKLEHRKQPEVLLEAVKNVNKNKQKTIKLLIVGNGPLESKIMPQIENDINIFYLPFQNQQIMPVIYRMGQIFCLPSQEETWGLGVNEAMACSRPVIVSNRVGCSVDLVMPDKNGYVFRYNQVNELENILKTLTFSRCKSMGNYAKEFIKNWSFEKIVAQ